MNQLVNGVNWKYIMDYYQYRDTTDAHLWITKGKIPGQTVWVQIGNTAPHSLPEGCQFPEPPKAPTKCQMSYKLGEMLSQTWGDMLLTQTSQEANNQREQIIKYSSTQNSEVYIGDQDEDYKDATDEVTYLDPITYPHLETEITVSTKYINVHCPGSDKVFRGRFGILNSVCNTQTTK